jgi:hypothetical protein
MKATSVNSRCDHRSPARGRRLGRRRGNGLRSLLRTLLRHSANSSGRTSVNLASANRASSSAPSLPTKRTRARSSTVRYRETNALTPQLRGTANRSPRPRPWITWIAWMRHYAAAPAEAARPPRRTTHRRHNARFPHPCRSSRALRTPTPSIITWWSVQYICTRPHLRSTRCATGPIDGAVWPVFRLGARPRNLDWERDHGVGGQS